jgi:aminoglycoside phosphotransferase family enzyme
MPCGQHGAVEAKTTQARIVELLSAPETHPHVAGDVVHVQTHISHVFLAGDFVYKLKKAVTFPFLDFGSVAAREHWCREELRLNRRLAAPVYLDVLPVVETDGTLGLGGAGTPIDWVVRMRRLPAARVLAELVDDPSFDGPGVMRRLAAHRARSSAPHRLRSGGGPDALMAAWNENLRACAPDGRPPPRGGRLRRAR